MDIIEKSMEALHECFGTFSWVRWKIEPMPASWNGNNDKTNIKENIVVGEFRTWNIKLN